MGGPDPRAVIQAVLIAPPNQTLVQLAFYRKGPASNRAAADIVVDSHQLTLGRWRSEPQPHTGRDCLLMIVASGLRDA